MKSTTLRGLSALAPRRRHQMEQQEVLERTYDAQQVEYMREACISVDETDRILGAVSKRDAHSAEHLVLHRAFSVFSFTHDNKLLMQKRSAEKITFPNLWTNTCCSHPLHTPQEMDGTLGAKRAAIRKLEHELGITGVTSSEFRMHGRFVYRAEMGGAPWGEHELDYVLVLRGVGMERCRVNGNEVAEIREVGLEELRAWMGREPSSFTPWLKLLSKTSTFEKWWSKQSETTSSSSSSSEDTNIYKLN